MPPDPPERSAARPLVLVAIALALTALAYVPALPGELQFDDDLYVPRGGPSSWRDLARVGEGRPLTALTFALNRATTGLAPVPLHLTNVLLHLAAAVLAWLLVRGAFREAGHPRADPLAAAVAGTFALHPMQAESVAYLVQRAEVLASALSVASLLLLLRAERSWGSRGGWTAWAWAGVAFAAGVAAKPVAIVVPAAYLAHRAFLAPGADPRVWRRRLAIAAPLLAGCAAVSASVLLALRHSPDAGLSAGSLGPWRYLLTQAGVILAYLRLLAWPAGQTIEHSVRESPGLVDGPTLAAVAGVAVLVGAALALRRSAAPRAGDAAPAGRLAAFGVAWFLLWLAPTSSVVPLADPMFEHRAYLASLGAFTAAVAAVDLAISRLAAPLRRRAAAVALGVTWAALAALTLGRATVWSRADALWTEATVRSPDSRRAFWNLGSALDRRGDLEGALAAFRRTEALELASAGEAEPTARRGPAHPVLQENIASVLRRLGRAPEARRTIERALERDGSNPSLHDDLAILLVEAGELDAAERHAREAIRLAPGHAPYWETLAEIAQNRGDVAAQVAAMRRSAALDPRFTERDVGLAELEARLGNAAEACAAWERVVRFAGDERVRVEAERRRRGSGCGGAARPATTSGP